MSEHYDFHYQPTGSGAISGQQVLEQTEDAINELGDYVYDNVGGAMDVAQEALETAQNAEQDAQTALDTANSFSSAIQSAQQDASTALSTAQTAQTTASNANATAIQAQQDASSAVTTANNASGQVSTLSGTVTALGQRVTTAEGNIGQNTSDITALTTRVGTAEGNITTLQNDVTIAQGNASSAMATAGTVKQQSYVLRYSSATLVASSTNSNSLLDNTDNLKVGDKVLDSSGNIYVVTAIDTANSTFTIGTSLIDLAQDSDVVHRSGDETVGGIKSFSDDTYIKSLNFTNEVASPSSSGSAVMPIVTTVTYGDSSPSQSARLNFRVTANGIKSLYPHENNQYALGLQSRKWSEVRAIQYYYGSSDVEFSTKFVTTDTAQTITERKTFTKNVTIKNEDVTIGSTSGAGSKDLTFTDSADNALAKITADKVSNGSSSIAFRVDTTDSNDANINSQFQFFIAKSGVKVINPTLDNDISLGRTSNRWKDTCTCLINGIEPSALSLPDLTAGVDISGYITAGNNHNEYTPSVDGWISVALKSTSGACALWIYQNDLFNGYYGSTARPGETELFAATCLPVKANTVVNIDTKGSNSYVYAAKFYPCQGNV